MPPPNQISHAEDLFKDNETKHQRRMTAAEREEVDQAGEKDTFETKDDLEEKIRRRSK